MWDDASADSLKVHEVKRTIRKHRHTFRVFRFRLLQSQAFLNVMGPSSVSEGVMYSLVVGKRFRERYKAVGVPKQESKTIVWALVVEWISRYGCPVVFHNSKNFMSQLLPGFCENHGVWGSSATSFNATLNAKGQRKPSRKTSGKMRRTIIENGKLSSTKSYGLFCVCP